MPPSTDDPSTVRIPLRVLLKSATSEAHARLDAVMSQLDLRHEGPRATYSRILYRSTRRVGRACAWQGAEAGPLMRRMVETLGADFPTETPVADDAPLDPDAVAYVMLGSQMGLALLRQGLAPDQRTGALAMAPDTAAWTAFIDRIARQPMAAAKAERLVADACRVFAIFHDEAVKALVPAAERTP